MVYRKLYMIELACLEKINDEHLFRVIKKNYPKSYIKLLSCNEVILSDVKQKDIQV